MTKNNNTIFWIMGIAIVVFIILPSLQAPEEEGMIGLTPHYLDKDGNEIFPSRGFTIVGGTPDVHEIYFDISATNLDVPITNIQVVDASPQAFKDALPTTTQSLTAGQSKTLWTSIPMDTVQFEAVSPVNFWIEVSGKNTYTDETIYTDRSYSGDIKFEPEAGCSGLDPIPCMENPNCITGWYDCIDLATASCSDIQAEWISSEYPEGATCEKKPECVHVGNGICGEERMSDQFLSSSLDTNKWDEFTQLTGSVGVSGGICDLSTGTTSSSMARITTDEEVSLIDNSQIIGEAKLKLAPGTSGESHVSMGFSISDPDLGSAFWIGGDDDAHMQYTSTDAEEGQYGPIAVAVDTTIYHVYKIVLSSEKLEFYIDNELKGTVLKTAAEGFPADVVAAKFRLGLQNFHNYDRDMYIMWARMIVV